MMNKNNLVSAVDSQKNATKFEYNAGSDLTGITDPKGSKYTYTYDKKHNVTSGKWKKTGGKKHLHLHKRQACGD